MGTKIRNKEGQEIIITPDDFIWFWKQVGEFTSSSSSGIHYSHYKALTKCKLSSKIHAQQFIVIARGGVYTKRWNMSLQVLPGKTAGVCFVKKTEINSTVRSRFQLLPTFHFWQRSHEFTHRQRIPPQGLF